MPTLRWLAAGCALLATAAFAQTHSSSSASNSSMSSVSPANFVTQASRDGATEVQLGQLAVDKANSAQVRKFAQQMVNDHTKANAELSQLAATKNLPVANSPDPAQQQVMMRLSALSGDNFDKEYMNHMTAAHGKAVALFTTGSQSNDAEIAAFAKKTLPTLKMHQQMAISLASGSTHSDAAK